MNNMVANAATGTTAQAPLHSHEHLLETFDSSLEAALGVGDRSKQKAVATKIGGNNRKNSLESSGTLYSQTPLRIRPPQNRLNKSQAVSAINASATNTQPVDLILVRHLSVEGTENFERSEQDLSLEQ